MYISVVLRTRLSLCKRKREKLFFIGRMIWQIPLKPGENTQTRHKKREMLLERIHSVHQLK